jgi:CDP-glucose 4,6-dehydratase
VEDLELSAPQWDRIRGKRIFVTGHTGFKGTWLVLLLERLGCEVSGYALAPATQPNLFELTSASSSLAASTLGDIRDAASLRSALSAASPELVLHLAAQPIVRRGYLEPRETWETNVLGTVNVLDAMRSCPSIRGAVMVTTDKVYENRAWDWGYREIDQLGGYDPYSASKAATELAVASYRQSFFSDGGPLVASARAGNVIGGGDWSEDRILADAARAVSAGKPLVVRNPQATRPWQHVLDCLSGYLSLANALLGRDRTAASAFNFGPEAADNVSVGSLIQMMKQSWPELSWQQERPGQLHPHEASFLYLDSSKARRVLGWAPRWTLATAARQTANWYRAVLRDPTTARSTTIAQIEEFLQA